MANSSDMKEYVSKELNAHTCSICYDVMRPPLKAPTLVVPCGHTFCKQCLMSHLKVTFKKQCPACRGRIKSHCVNFSLQQVIQSLEIKEKELSQAKYNNSNGDDDDEFNISPEKYFRKYRLLCMRTEVLSNRLSDLEKMLFEETERAEAARIVINHLEVEEEETKKSLKLLNEQLNLIQSHLEKKQDEYNSHCSRRKDLSEQMQSVHVALKPLNEELDKAKLILEKISPDLMEQ